MTPTPKAAETGRETTIAGYRLRPVTLDTGPDEAKRAIAFARGSH